MGFGVLFIGYFVTYVMSYAFIPRLLGYAIMAYGLYKLCDYEPKFRFSLLCMIPLGVCGIFGLIRDIFGYVGVESAIFSGTALTANIFSTAEEAVTLLFHIGLMISVASLAGATELPKLRMAAMRNMYIIEFSELVFFAALLIPAGDIRGYVSYAAFILRIIWIILDVVLLINAYRMICPEGEENMPVKESKIGIIRKMESTLNKHDDDMYDAARKISEKRSEKKKNKRKK